MAQPPNSSYSLKLPTLFDKNKEIIEDFEIEEDMDFRLYR